MPVTDHGLHHRVRLYQNAGLVARGSEPCRARVASVYERGGYEDRIDYPAPPPPPVLTDAESAWVEAMLEEKGLRGGSADSAREKPETEPRQ
jgi:hypothetical protein